MKLTNYRGFSLIELTITVSIIAVLMALSIPLYTQYIVRAHRLLAVHRLAELAQALENYHFEHQTYQGANFTTLHFSVKELKNYYHILIPSTSQDSFLIAAKPIRKQALRDKKCGTLFLSSSGEKTVSGDGKSQGCWG